MTGRGRARSRRWRFALLTLVVVLAHGWIASWLAESTVGWGSRDVPPPRLQASFVRELEVQASPPPPAPSTRSARRRLKPKVKAPAPAASQPSKDEAAERAPASVQEPAAVVQAESPAASLPSDFASAPFELAAAASEPASAASESASAASESASAASEPASAAAPALPVVPAASAASQPAATPFEWPPNTRLSYRLTGHYRGPLEGYARVQWIREGLHYQVQLDVTVSLLFTRTMISDGELTEQGLAPRRYDEETRFGPIEPRHLTLRFEPDHIVMPDGRSRPTLPGVQDTASHLVQMTWLFITQPQLLRPGTAIDVPLALPRRVDTWVYDVLQPERVDTPIGTLDTFHLKPRRPSDPSNLMTVETWIAPALQYLPVRLRINQNDDTYLDLLIERRPQQSER
jgi:hypothetical protein